MRNQLLRNRGGLVTATVVGAWILAAGTLVGGCSNSQPEETDATASPASTRPATPAKEPGASTGAANGISAVGDSSLSGVQSAGGQTTQGAAPPPTLSNQPKTD